MKRVSKGKKGGPGRAAGKSAPRAKASRAKTRAAATGGRAKAAPARAASVARAAGAGRGGKAPARHGRRADFGAPIEGFLAAQPPELREILVALRELVEEMAPDATAALKWGMPVYTIGGTMMCALTAHKSHVNLVLAGPPAAFADPDGLLEGSGETGRHLALRSIQDLPRESVRRWLGTSAQLAREKG